MAGMNFIGSYSGIDKTTIDQLMAVEKQPLIQMSEKKTAITDKQNAWKDVNTRLNSLSEKVKALENKDTFTTMQSTSTNDKNVSMVAGKNAPAGNYKISVSQLATNSSTIFGKADMAIDQETGEYSNTKQLGIADGSFTIGNKEGNSATIEIKVEDSLTSIVAKINATTKDYKVGDDVVNGTGISATIVDNRLVLTDTKTGDRNISLIAEGNTLVDLGLDYAGEGDKKASNIEGQIAKFNINGIDVVSDSNSVTDVLEGTTINLTKTHILGDYDIVTVAKDNSVLENAVKEFVDQYNSTMTFIEEQLKVGDPDVEGSKGALAGDSSLMRLHSSLRNLVTSPVNNDNTDINAISDLGVTTIDKYGKLQFDSSKLSKALLEDSESVAKFFVSKDENGNNVGFTSRLKDHVDTYISSNKGVIKIKTDGFEKTLKDLTKQIDRFNLRMIKKEEYYIKKFTALDVALMNAESQKDWLQGQMDSMNASKKK